MSFFKRWFMRPWWTVRDVGVAHGEEGYPSADTFVQIPLYGWAHDNAQVLCDEMREAQARLDYSGRVQSQP